MFVYSLKLHNISRRDAGPAHRGLRDDQPDHRHGHAAARVRSSARSSPASTTAPRRQQASSRARPSRATRRSASPAREFRGNQRGSGYPPDASGGPGGGSYTIGLLVQPIATSKGTFTNNATSAATRRPATTSPPTPRRSQCREPGRGDEGVPALCVTKTDGDPVPQGAAFSYAASKGNRHERAHGPEDAFRPTKPVVTDSLPPGMTVQSTTVEGGSCGTRSGGGVLTCTLNPDFLRRRRGTSRSTRDRAGHRHVRQPRLHRGRSSGCAIETTTIIAAGDLAITKTARRPRSNVNSPVTYTITVTNNGPAAMPNAVVTDDIQAHLALVSIDPCGPTCGSAGARRGRNVQLQPRDDREGPDEDDLDRRGPQQQGTYSNLAKIVPDSDVGRADRHRPDEQHLGDRDVPRERGRRLDREDRLARRRRRGADADLHARRHEQRPGRRERRDGRRTRCPRCSRSRP